MKDIPLYIGSIETARQNNELDEYRKSLSANMDCKLAIENVISRNFDGMHLNHNSAKEVIDVWGFDRVLFVLANTVQQKEYDGRFSHDNKEWAETFYIPEDRRRYEFTVESHPAVLDGFIDLARQSYTELNLWDKSHCIPTDNLDFENKIMVLNPTGIKDEYKTPDFQLFLAQGGFGCSPTASGRQVYGRFLADGEYTHFDRSRFIGQLKPELVPDWAKEKAKEFQKPSIKKQLAEAPKQTKPQTKNIDKGAR